ncbi:hypothetical protein JZX86_23110 [Agrobacterium rosae]|uniref:hypothetical protein n=1 Tax=Agrobacterium rosae TaxID=1972867 RepID=UPI0019D3ECD7|nr:hypothetical protein [Agrobacterium rosae]MBN7808236.1 hypothetical protein [Agrobacterium rosae]
MHIRKIDDATALIVIDLQEGTRCFVGQAGPQVYAVAALLARTFRARDLQVLLIISEGGKMGRTDTSPDGGGFMFFPLRPNSPLEQAESDIVVRRGPWGR